MNNSLGDGTERFDSEEPIVVTVDDGTSFRCHREVVHPNADETPPSIPSPFYRWIVTATDGVSRIGPPVLKDSSPAALRRHISEWYRVKSRIRQWDDEAPTITRASTNRRPTAD